MINKKCIVMILLGVFVVAGILYLPEAFAQDAADQEIVTKGMSLKEMVAAGRWPMYVLGAMSILAVSFIVYFSTVLNIGQVAPKPLHGKLIKTIIEGDLEEARKECEYKSCPLSKVTLSGLDYIKSMTHVNPAILKDVMEGEGGRQAEALTGQTQYLNDIGGIAPMVGLLGTVLGMLQAFSGVALNIANAKPVVLAAGVSQALVTTAFGLMIGIPAMIAYSYFRRRALNLVSYLESASTDVMTALTSGGSDAVSK